MKGVSVENREPFHAMTRNELEASLVLAFTSPSVPADIALGTARRVMGHPAMEQLLRETHVCNVTEKDKNDIRNGEDNG